MLNEILQQHLDKVLEEYTSGAHYQSLLEAKKYYFDITGIADEDDDDFESRMSSFNDWYILQFVSKDNTRTPIKDYVENNELDDEVKSALTNVRHSFFQFNGKNFRKQMMLKDVLYGNKLNLAKDHQELGILKGDAFLGRVIEFDEQHFLLNGISVVPKESVPIIKKEAKRVRRLNDEYEEQQFLHKIEFLKNKWRRYGHLDPGRIFHFKD